MTPDITTPEGRAEIERVVMRVMGWSEWVHHPGGHEEWIKGFRRVRVGWLYTGDGMVAVKRWFAQERGVIVSSQPATMQHGDAFAEVVWTDEDGSDKVWAEAADEPTAVALALYRALEEVGE